MALLPQFVVLKSKSNGKYLRYVEEPNRETYVKFCGDKIFGSDAKFEIKLEYDVPANQGCSQPGLPRRGPTSHTPSQLGHAHKAKLVHIRCCYNNRFLVGVDDKWIVPEAQEPETDKSKPSCTLFQPIIANANANTFQFRHVQLQRFLSIDEHVAHTLSADPTKPKVECVVIDLDSLLRLPKRVRFRDDRGYYLRYHDRRYMQFAENVDKGKGPVMNEVFVTGDGYVRIKSHRHGGFWRRDPKSNWICADYDGDPNGKHVDDALFWPVKVGDNTIALCSKHNNMFCRRVTNFWKKDCLRVARDGIIKEAHLVVEELPMSNNRIANVQFRLEHARIINNETDVIVCTKEVANGSYTENLIQELKLSYGLEKSRSWSSSIQSKLGFRATFTAGIPQIVNGKLEISGEASNSFQWGNTEKKTVQFESKVTVNVKPRTIATATVSATKASYDVPFSYTPCDTPPGCNDDSDKMEDGVYSFVTWLDIKDHTDDKPMDATPAIKP